MSAHAHKLIKRPDNAIGCQHCKLHVPQPEGMPDYTKAGMQKW